MLRRIALLVVLTAAVAACAGGSEGALNTLIEQVRLGDPLSDRTYAENREIIEVPASIPTLTEHLTEDQSPAVRQYCALILGRIGDPQAVPVLTEALSDSDAGVRDRALGALQQIGEEETQQALIDVLANGSNQARVMALVELERAGTGAAIPAIAELAKSGEGMASSTAVDTLGGIGGAEAVAPLVEIALDASLPQDKRHAAILNLGRIEDPAAAAGLEEVLTGLAEQPETEALQEFARSQQG